MVVGGFFAQFGARTSLEFWRGDGSHFCLVADFGMAIWQIYSAKMVGPLGNLGIFSRIYTDLSAYLLVDGGGELVARNRLVAVEITTGI